MRKIVIIGAGISGLMTAYELSKNKDNDITILEKGKALTKRHCPILEHKTDKCVKCSSCSIMEGLGGAGAFSDGKYNITTEFGGWLQNFIGNHQVIDLENKAINILEKFGAKTGRYRPDNELKKICLQNNLTMLQSECIHLGTDDNYEVMLNFVNYLQDQDNVNILTDIDITGITEDKRIFFNYADETESRNMLAADIIIFAIGRSGSQFFADWCRQNKVSLINNQVDIGVRVEVPSLIWDDIDSKIYEPKILYRTKQYGDICRMFCHNPHGEVVNENTDGIITVNGHAYNGADKKTNSTNFALLSTINFTEPFKEPIEYAKHVAKLANMISGGTVIVQTLGDLEKGRRSDAKRIKQNTTEQTLTTAIPGDLSLCMPKRQLDNIIETLHALDKIAPGTANPGTLLYGVECKYYSARPEANENFELLNKPGIFAIGDGAGFTRSLAQAAAQGLHVADYINKKVTNAK